MVHEGQIGVRAEMFGYGRQNVPTIVYTARQNQVSDEDAFCRASGFIHKKLAAVFQHPSDGRKRCIKVARRGGKAIRQPLIVVLQVGQPDIHIV